jgi:hypothetical protein
VRKDTRKYQTSSASLKVKLTEMLFSKLTSQNLHKFYNLQLSFIFFMRLESFLSCTFLPVSKARTNKLCILRQCKYIKEEKLIPIFKFDMKKIVGGDSTYM